ncbi:MAG: hypothetical protein HUJ56_08440, partial [Erysipelotrichaceae bacterium]|nr:hypothetical protein [Erysipelotrichaceae bacterium]
SRVVNTGSNNNNYYGSGSSSGRDYEAEQRNKEEKAIANQGAISGYDWQTLKQAFDNINKNYDVADQQSENIRRVQTQQNKMSATDDWDVANRKLQNATRALTGKMGNALYGSAYEDTNNIIRQQEDYNDVDILNNMRENQNNIDNEYFKAIMDNVNARNEAAMETEQKGRNVVSQYAAQVNSIAPDRVNGEGDYPIEGVSNLFDTEGHTINEPDFLNPTGFADANRRGAVDPTTQGFYRGDNVYGESVTINNGKTNTDQAANKSYWDKLKAGYERR